jgi:hypothetical protein
MNSPSTRRDLFRLGTHGALTATVFAGLSGRPAWADPPKDGGDADKLYPGFPRSAALYWRGSPRAKGPV